MAEATPSKDAWLGRISIQESFYPELTCFGCGHANPDGFHLSSYREGDLTVAEFTSRPMHDNGFGFLNGGIIATVLDCHSAAVVMWEVAERGWTADPGAPAPFLTSELAIKFVRPTPLAATLQLTAWPRSVSEEEIVVETELSANAKVRATAVATWLRFHPR